jgi:Domain of unknown function (DUF4386)
LQALARAFASLHHTGYFIGLVFFGFHCLLLGYLLYRSTFFPRFLGVLLALAGASYLVNSFVGLLAPDLQQLLSPWIFVPALGELVLVIRLIVAGVNAAKWNEMAGVSPNRAA